MLLSHALLRFDLPVIETTWRRNWASPAPHTSVWEPARMDCAGLDRGSSCHCVVFYSSSHVYDASGSKNGNAPPATLRAHVIVKEFWRHV